MPKMQTGIRRALKLSIFFIIIIGALIAFSNLNKLREHLISINFLCLLFSLLSAFCVYATEGLFLIESLKLFRERLPVLSALKYSLIINSLGYLVSLGGITPFATQVYILDFHNIGAKKATLTRILQVMLFNMIFTTFLVIGFIFILFNRARNEFDTPLLTIPFFVLLVIVSIFYLTIFWKKFRAVSIKILTGVINKICKLFFSRLHIQEEKVMEFLEEFDEGIHTLLMDKKYLFFIGIIILVDWVFWLSIIYFAFLSINYRIGFGALIIGFSIGQIIGIVSMVPGGIGTLEASMALAFKAFGVPFETALVSVLLYRITFYIIPFIFSLPLYFSLKKKIQ